MLSKSVQQLEPLLTPSPRYLPPLGKLVCCSDHRAVCLYIEKAVGKRGQARRTIREELMLEPDIQNECMQLITKALTGTTVVTSKGASILSRALSCSSFTNSG